MIWTTEVELVDNDKSMCIPQSVYVAALLFMEWMQVKNQQLNTDMPESQLTFVHNKAQNEEGNSR